MDLKVVAHGQNDALLHKPKSCDWEPVNVHDQYVQELGRFAVMEHVHGLCGVGMTFIRVVSGESKMVCEGKKYSLVVEVKEVPVLPHLCPAIKLYVADVLDKQCAKSWELLAFKPFCLPPMGPGPVIHNA
ncbi:putative cysteine proteinase inhibitor 7, partial [Cucurbita argyrosperma subsp. sororia]